MSHNNNLPAGDWQERPMKSLTEEHKKLPQEDPTGAFFFNTLILKLLCPCNHLHTV